MPSLLGNLAVAVLALSALVATVTAAPFPHSIVRQTSHPAAQAGLRMIDGPVKPHSYLVKWSATANKTQHAAWVHRLVADSTATGATQARVFTGQTFDGYSAELDADKVAQVLASGDVEWVEQDAMMRTMGFQSGATWGLQRISSSDPFPSSSTLDPTELIFNYRFNPAAGTGVDVYVVDTGILTSHTQFGGRASMVYVTPGLNDTDDNGHGSHVAGTVGAATFGVAKNVNLLGVKVIAADGSGSTSDIISGIDFAVQSAHKSGRPSVITMSIGGAKTQALDESASSAIASGVHVIAAAGNESQDASNDSPASAPGVIAVGSMNINDAVSSFSNFGPGVTVFAPGERIVSCGIASDTATAVLSGTSQATPHISGIVALLLSEDKSLKPSEMLGLVRRLAVSGQLGGVPNPSTANLIGQNFVANTTVPQFS